MEEALNTAIHVINFVISILDGSMDNTGGGDMEEALNTAIQSVINFVSLTWHNYKLTILEEAWKRRSILQS